MEKWALTEEEERGLVDCSANEKPFEHTSPKTRRSIADQGRGRFGRRHKDASV
jgi:hypothetical protein